MRCGHLFNGIGGFALAAHWMGWTNVFHCEIDDFCNRVMNKHFPNSIQHGNIKEQDFTGYRGTIDLLTGGFPCQPYSAAGKRKGKEDERHLWPEMLRAIREIQPGWIVGENVRGLTNWNGGLVFDEVQADLEAEGYEVLPFLLPACAVNAPHRRDRIWFIAHAHDIRSSQQNESTEQSRGTKVGGAGKTDGRASANADSKRTAAGAPRRNQSWELFQAEQREENKQFDQSISESGLTSNPNSKGLEAYGIGGSHDSKGWQNERRCIEQFASDDWSQFPTQPPVCGKYDGISAGLVRYIKPEIYATISQKYTDKNLQEVWAIFQSKEIREKIGRLYKIHEPGILLQILQLCSAGNQNKEGLSAFCEKASKELLRKMRKYGSFTNSPQGRKLEKQFRIEFGDSLPFLSHEIALVAMEAERRTVYIMEKHRQESIKALGNAIVPQVAYQIFKAIEQYNKQTI